MDTKHVLSGISLFALTLGVAYVTTSAVNAANSPEVCKELSRLCDVQLDANGRALEVLQSKRPSLPRPPVCVLLDNECPQPPKPTCGNNVCESGEANKVDPGGCGPNAAPECLGPPAQFVPGTCPQDCGQKPEPVCGNAVCEAGEADEGSCGPNPHPGCLGSPAIFKKGTCQKDCVPKPKTRCGDGVCEGGETDLACASASPVPCGADYVYCPSDCEKSRIDPPVKEVKPSVKGSVKKLLTF